MDTHTCTLSTYTEVSGTFVGIHVIVAAPTSVPETSSCELDSLKKPYCKRSSRLRSRHNCQETDNRPELHLGLSFTDESNICLGDC